MTATLHKNLPASVRQRLLNYAFRTEQDFQVILARYGFERLLYRLGQSPFAEQFTLKGSLMFLVWTGEQYRPTRDMDLMSRKEIPEEDLRGIFRSVCMMNVNNDGLVLLENTVDVELIREDNRGMRVTLTGRLEQARIPLQIDIGFADAVTPKAVLQNFPVLLDFAVPRISMYPPETTIAEKLHTIIVRGIFNSRMKDYYDIWILCREFAFDGAILSKAIAATFRQRNTNLSERVPTGLSDEFSTDAAKQTQWVAFIRRTPLKICEENIEKVVTSIRDFLMPPYWATASGISFTRKWPKDGPWQ